MSFFLDFKSDAYYSLFKSQYYFYNSNYEDMDLAIKAFRHHAGFHDMFPGLESVCQRQLTQA